MLYWKVIWWWRFNQVWYCRSWKITANIARAFCGRLLLLYIYCWHGVCLCRRSRSHQNCWDWQKGPLSLQLMTRCLAAIWNHYYIPADKLKYHSWHNILCSWCLFNIQEQKQCFFDLLLICTKFKCCGFYCECSFQNPEFQLQSGS